MFDYHKWLKIRGVACVPCKWTRRLLNNLHASAPRTPHYVSNLLVIVLVCAGLFFTTANVLYADNEGQEDLSLATEAKLAAENFNDLGEVVRLCERALEKGLDEENSRFANHLLAATLVQRAEVASKMIFGRGVIDPKWVDYRRLALVDLEKAVSRVPEEPEALVLIAKLNLLPGGDKRRALEALNTAIAIKEADSRIHASALLLRAGCQQDTDKRLADLNAALELEPKMVEALRARGSHYATVKKPKEALRDLEAADAISPDHPSTLEALALLLSNQEKYDQALERLDRLQELRPGQITPLLIKARIHAIRTEMDQAMECLNRALELQPGNLDVMLLRASLYNELKQPDKALADVDRVLELEPNEPKARRMRAMLLANAGKIDEVVDELESILRIKPDDLGVQMQLGIVHTMMQNPRKAIDVFSKILAKDPDSVEALVGRAGSFLTVGKHAESIADYDKALELGGDEDSGLLNNFAWVLATSPDDKLRDGPRAVKLATKACEMTDYKQAHILSTLAAAYAETGDFDSAIKWSQKALELGKETADKQTQESLAKELESFQNGTPWRERLSEEDLKASHTEQQTASDSQVAPESETEDKMQEPQDAQSPSKSEKTKEETSPKNDDTESNGDKTE